MGHLGAAVDAGAQAQRDEALDGVGQLGVLQVVVEDGGRARMRQQIAVPLLQPARWKPPVPLCRPLHTLPPVSLPHRRLWPHPASKFIPHCPCAKEHVTTKTTSVDRSQASQDFYIDRGMRTAVRCCVWNAGWVQGWITVSWFSRKVTARDGHQPITPGGFPLASRSRQYSLRCAAQQRNSMPSQSTQSATLQDLS